MFCFRIFSRILAGCSLTLILSASSPVPAKPVAKPTSPLASSFFYPEVRLRKLHLVRPDLIPYPIYYKIYC